MGVSQTQEATSFFEGVLVVDILGDKLEKQRNYLPFEPSMAVSMNSGSFL